LNLAKDNANWQRTLSITPLPAEVRRKAALYVAGRAAGRGRAQCRDDARSLLAHLGLLDEELRTTR
jgi:hypothetical protein